MVSKKNFQRNLDINSTKSTFNHIVKRVKDHVVTFSVTADKYVSDKKEPIEAVMGGEIVEITEPVKYCPSGMNDDLFYVIKIDDGIGQFFVDLKDVAYNYFKESLKIGNIVLVEGRLSILKRNIDKEVHLYAWNIKVLCEDEEFEKSKVQ